jgi:predicted permease
MFDLLIVAVMFSILVSLGIGLYFLVRDRGRTERAVLSLSVRVGLSILLLALLAFGFASRAISPGVFPGG